MMSEAEEVQLTRRFSAGCSESIESFAIQISVAEDIILSR